MPRVHDRGGWPTDEPIDKSEHQAMDWEHRVNAIRQVLGQKALLRSDELRRGCNKLITCDISGYGDSGPYAQMKAYDNLLQGETGLLAVTGTADAPAKVGVSLADIGAGLHAYAAILEALIVREKTGKEQRSKSRCLTAWLTG